MKEFIYEHWFKNKKEALEDIETILKRFNFNSIKREDGEKVLIEATNENSLIIFELKERVEKFTKEIKEVKIVKLKIIYDKEEIFEKFRRAYEIKILRGGA
ncbi:hypothetical protein HRbin06_01049 [archaeon HR06]|nr:hypothetical protein HRbin06_01049 [archaeon HR06]